MERFVYLDNAATTFPKARPLMMRMLDKYMRYGVSPGRGGYDSSVEASRLVWHVRELVADLFDAPVPQRVVFTSNATDALNLAIQGLLRPGDHVVSTRLEHNSVLRPLYHLRARADIEFDLVPFDANGLVNPFDIAAAMTHKTRLVVVTHASQVLGTVQPMAEIGRLCCDRRVPLLVDVAQTAGHVPVRLNEWGASAVAFTGHKALLGPSGIGGLVVSRDAQVTPTRVGGTGLESESLTQPQTYPERLEAGTLNLLGVIGLGEGIAFLGAESMSNAHTRQMDMIRKLREGLSGMPEVTVYSPEPRDEDVPILTCNVNGMESADVAAILDADYGIAVRSGLHCAPLVHTDLGTLERGAVRFSLSRFTVDEDITRALYAMQEISRVP